MSVSTTPLFGRSWKLQVLSADGSTLIGVSSNEWEPEALRITFAIEQNVGRALWQAEISIYNLDPSTVGLIDQGALVSLSAGYQATGEPTEIWRGAVFQATYERVGVTDFVLTLHSILGLDDMLNKYFSVTTGPVQKQSEIVRNAAKSIGIKIAYIEDDSAFSAILPRSKTVFGTPQKLFTQIADQNNMTAFYGPDGLMLGSVKATSATPDIIYAPALGPTDSPGDNESQLTRSLIGSPEQTQLGVTFRVLLDPRLKCRLPVMQVKLDQAIIRQQAFQFGVYSSVLSQDGIYLVSGVRHVGDSRGNEWYSEVCAVTSVEGRMAMLNQTGA